MFSLIWPVSHSIPSCSPSPVAALLAQICQGLSSSRSRPGKWGVTDKNSCRITEDLKSFAVTFVGNNNYRVCGKVLNQFCTFHLGFVTPSHLTSHLWGPFCWQKTISVICGLGCRDAKKINDIGRQILINRLQIVTWRSMSSSSLATTILSLSLESTTKMIPWQSL